MRYLFLVFLVLPILEIWLFIQVGGIIGALNTIVLVILSSIAGTTAVRRQGLRNMLTVRTHMAHGQMPTLDILEGFLISLGGLLMILPGFITDTIGITLLIPWIRKKAFLRFFIYKQSHTANAGIYEGEYYREPDEKKEKASIIYTTERDTQQNKGHDDTKKK